MYFTHRAFLMISSPAKKTRLLSSMASFTSNWTDAIVLSDMPEGGVVIGTHNGGFHCDEALAISMLRLLPQYRDSPIVRTRDPDLLAKCDIIVDVGAQYDPPTHRYDHHQREFTDVFDGYKTKLSSAGLVYKHFGKDILRIIYGTDVAPSTIDICYQKLYADFIEHIDAIDNGRSVADGVLHYKISSTLSNRVGHLNPAWNEAQTNEIQNDRFKQAISLTGSEFVQAAQSLVNTWWPARSIVHDALASRMEVHASGKIIMLSQCCPWKDHLFELEKEVGANVLYALFQDTGGSWRIQAVPVTADSFDSRKKLPDEWRGLRDDVLSAKTGIPGGIFIHASGFIGGHADKEGALAMTIMALDL